MANEYTKKLANRRILLIVSGSIAAYKSPDVVRRLQDLGAEVKVCITQGGLQFITTMSLEVVSKQSVVLPSDDLKNSLINHIELARWADAILVVPASANIIAQIAGGEANSIATGTILASEVPVFIAPAMNQQMLNNVLTKQNIARLKNLGMTIIPSPSGKQVCGDVGAGCLANSDVIADAVASGFYQGKLRGKRIIITAGSTQEAIDPVRYISSHSSGKMALALAQACTDQGAELIFIYGRMQLEPPKYSQNVKALSADDMYQAVMTFIGDCDIFIAVAAVADYRVEKIADQKMKRGHKNLSLSLSLNRDILKSVCQRAHRPLTVGFAAETNDIMGNAQKKYQAKGCDLLVVNDVSGNDIGFKSDDNEVIILHTKGTLKIPRQSKLKIAHKIVDLVADFFKKQRASND